MCLCVITFLTFEQKKYCLQHIFWYWFCFFFQCHIIIIWRSLSTKRFFSLHRPYIHPEICSHSEFFNEKLYIIKCCFFTNNQIKLIHSFSSLWKFGAFWTSELVYIGESILQLKLFFWIILKSRKNDDLPNNSKWFGVEWF